MTTLVRPLLAAAFLLATAGVTFLAPVAEAHPPAEPFFISPDADSTLTVSDFVITTSVPQPTQGDTLSGINLTVRPLDAASGQDPISKTNTTGSFSVHVDWNGRYEATVTATSTNPGSPVLGLGAHGSQTSEPGKRGTKEGPRDFFVSAPPAVPNNVRPVIDNESRMVTLSWSANSEKDLLFYVVLRGTGDGAPAPLVKTDGPRQTSIVDPSTAEAGGEYRYQVVAVRRGATADKVHTSDPSPVAKANVPSPPGPTTTVAGGTTGSTAPGGGTGGTG